MALNEVAFGGLIIAIGALFLWEPLDRMLNGETANARVAEIRVVEPSEPDLVYKSPRRFDPEPNLDITFLHYVALSIDGQPVLYRVSVDTRKAPLEQLQVNKKVVGTVETCDS